MSAAGIITRDTLSWFLDVTRVDRGHAGITLECADPEGWNVVDKHWGQAVGDACERLDGGPGPLRFELVTRVNGAARFLRVWSGLKGSSNQRRAV